jgi:hypothetical protein
MRSGARCCTSETLIVPRITDLYAALPGITGKLELEYEGELRGADTIVREILRNAVARGLRQILQRDQHAADRAVVSSGRNAAGG